MVQALHPRHAMGDSDTLRLAGLQDSEHDAKTEQANAIGLPPANLRTASPMPIPVQASHHEPTERELKAASPTRVTGVSAMPIPQPASTRRDSANLLELEQKFRKHSATISEDCSSPVADRSNWPLLYQIIDVDPATEDSAFPEVARKSLIRLSLKHGPPVLSEHPEAQERWAVITEAYDALSDPEQRKLYDMQSS